MAFGRSEKILGMGLQIAGVQQRPTQIEHRILPGDGHIFLVYAAFAEELRVGVACVRLYGKNDQSRRFAVKSMQRGQVG